VTGIREGGGLREQEITILENREGEKSTSKPSTGKREWVRVLREKVVEKPRKGV